MKRRLTDVRTYEVDVPAEWSDEQIIEAYNEGDLGEVEVDSGPVKIEPMMAADGIAALDEMGLLP